VVGFQPTLPHGSSAAKIPLLLLPLSVLDPSGRVPSANAANRVFEFLALAEAVLCVCCEEVKRGEGRFEVSMEKPIDYWRE
jgi:hypothetical protein